MKLGISLVEVCSSSFISIPVVHKKKLECCHDKLGLSFSSGFNMGQNI